MRFLLLALIIATPCFGALPNLDRLDLGKKSVSTRTLQDRIIARMRETRQFYNRYSGNFVFVDEHKHFGKKFVRAYFCRPLPWFNWNERVAIDNFIKTTQTRFAENGIMLVANPRVEAVDYRGMTCMTITARISFIPEYARPESD